MAPHEAHSQSRRTKAKIRTKAAARQTTASDPNSRIAALWVRLNKATAAYNAAAEVASRYDVFDVSGKVESDNAARLVVYGRSTGQKATSANALGWNSEESFLIIYNAPEGSISYSRFEATCVALSQREFAPPPAAYRQAAATMRKYEDVTSSLRSEIAFAQNQLDQAAERAQRAQQAKVERALNAQRQSARRAANAQRESASRALNAQRESVYGARVTSADQEARTLLSKLDADTLAATDEGRARIQSSAAAMALFNKWGRLGVSQQSLLQRTFDDLALAAAWQVEQGDWGSARQSARQMLCLELFRPSAKDEKTNRERVELGSAETMPSQAATLVMRNRAPRNRAPRNRAPRNRAPRNRAPRNRAPRNRAPRRAWQRRGWGSCPPMSRERHRARRS